MFAVAGPAGVPPVLNQMPAESITAKVVRLAQAAATASATQSLNLIKTAIYIKPNERQAAKVPLIPNQTLTPKEPKQKRQSNKKHQPSFLIKPLVVRARYVKIMTEKKAVARQLQIKLLCRAFTCYFGWEFSRCSNVLQFMRCLKLMFRLGGLSLAVDMHASTRNRDEIKLNMQTGPLLSGTDIMDELASHGWGRDGTVWRCLPIRHSITDVSKGQTWSGAVQRCFPSHNCGQSRRPSWAIQYFSRIKTLQARMSAPQNPMTSFTVPRCVHCNTATNHFHVLALVYLCKTCVDRDDGEQYRVVTQTQALEMGLPRRGRELTQMPCVRFHSYNGTGTGRSVPGRYYLKSHIATAVERHWRRYARNKRHPEEEWRTLLRQNMTMSVVGKTKRMRKPNMASQTRGMLPNICFLQDITVDQSVLPEPKRVVNKDTPNQNTRQKKVGRPAIRSTFHKTVHVIGLGGMSKEMYETQNREERRKLLMRERQRARRKLVGKKNKVAVQALVKNKEPGVDKPPQPRSVNPVVPAAPVVPATAATPADVVSATTAHQIANIQRQQLAVIQQQQQQLAAMQRQQRQQQQVIQQRVAEQQRPNVWNTSKGPVANV